VHDGTTASDGQQHASARRTRDGDRHVIRSRVRGALGRFAFAAIVCACCAAPAGAVERRLLPGIGTDDHRAPVDSTVWPWQAIGRLNLSFGRSCTGTLVAPDRVLTAAHCLYDEQNGGQVSPSAVHFLPGYRLGEYTAHGVAVAIEMPEMRPPARQGPDSEAIAHDWAIVRLQSALPLRPIPVSTLAAGGGRPLLRAGYSQDRRYLLQVHDGCVVIGRLGDLPVLLTDCDATRGDSGSPLLQRDGEHYSVVGVTSAVADGQRLRGTFVVSAEAFAGRLDGTKPAAGVGNAR